MAARAEAHSRIEAPPSVVYRVLADYTTHHPRIMPAMFSRLEVEEGGVGAGTVFHITVRVAGRDKRLHMRVAEPEPGRILTETDLDTGTVTRFQVDPTGGGSCTTRMSSEWEPRTGLAGLIDRVVAPRLTHRVFTLQLRELRRYVRSLDPHELD